MIYGNCANWIILRDVIEGNEKSNYADILHKKCSYKFLNYPVSAKGIAEEMGIVVIDSLLLDKNVLGKIFLHEEDTQIILNGFNSLNIKNFLIAHMLGHCYLHHFIFNDTSETEDTISTHESDRSKQEKEANLFALDLLIPDDLLFRYLVHVRDTEGFDNLSYVDIINMLSKNFDVPYKWAREKFIKYGLNYF